ncbi:MAG: hypothetical protein HKN76_02590, partial [Saprospiraceae bacterium]|nr:hypothetical protein [Saprospiraceae bacterium]
YQDAYWTRHPYNPENNVNDLGPLIRQDFNTLKNAKVLRYQKQLIEKLAIELNEYDHIFFELCNEPWADNGTHTQFLHKTLIPKNDNLGWFIWATAANADAKAWQRELAATFRNAEAKLGKKHLLAQNYSNFKENLTKVDPNIDILNFHYAWPESVSDNYAWNRPINFDESGFAGSADTTYLQQAWAFIMSGGSIFNNLDYSFYVGSEDGTGDNEAPGGGSTRLRMQLKFLHDFINRFDFVELIPSTHLVKHSPGMEAYGMAQRDQSYAFYLQGNSQGYFTAHVDSGSYEVKVFSPDTGMQIDDFSLVATDTPARIKIPRANRLAISLVKSVD